MNEVQEKLSVATFRGVPFLFSSSQRSGGRKTVQHEYPNTDKRWVEDLGKIVPTFTLQALITGKEDYFQNRDRFTQALERPGSGLLSHPFYGTQTVHVIEYSLDEQTGALGRAEYSITFAVTGSVSSPTEDGSDGPVIRLRAEKIVEVATAVLQTNYQPSVINKAEHTYNKNILNGILDFWNLGISAILSLQRLDDADLEEPRTYLAQVQNNLNTIVSNEVQMVDTVINGFKSFDDIDLDADIAYSAYTAMFAFREDTELPDATTIQKKRNLENHYLITGVFNILALVYAYDAAKDIEYMTSDDVDRIHAQLEIQYKYILGIPNIDYDLLDNLRSIRTSMREFFNSTNKKVFRIVTVNTPVMPLAVLIHQYYGNLDVLEEVQTLNQIVELPFVSGSIRIFAE